MSARGGREGVTCLDHTLSQSHEVGANADGSTGHDADGEAFLVGRRCFARNHCRATQVFGRYVVFFP